MTQDEAIEELELELLLEAVVRRYGYDFRNYARGSLRRRVRAAREREGVATLSELQARLLRDRACFERFRAGLAVHATRLFRDPAVYRSFRRNVVPRLHTYPFLRIWHAGCSTGEEVYSLAIVLAEEGLYPRCRLYATDMSEHVVRRARRGVFPLAAVRDRCESYQQAGGRAELTDYFVTDRDNAVVRESLRDNIVFSHHNLVTDHSFNEFNVIFCRNVMIYFDERLRRRVHGVLYGSLGNFGVVVLGREEVMDYTPYATKYERLDATNRIYRRVR